MFREWANQKLRNEVQAGKRWRGGARPDLLTRAAHVVLRTGVGAVVWQEVTAAGRKLDRLAEKFRVGRHEYRVRTKSARAAEKVAYNLKIRGEHFALPRYDVERYVILTQELRAFNKEIQKYIRKSSPLPLPGRNETHALTAHWQRICKWLNRMSKDVVFGDRRHYKLFTRPSEKRSRR